jgi:hypothetical protein
VSRCAAFFSFVKLTALSLMGRPDVSTSGMTHAHPPSKRPERTAAAPAFTSEIISIPTPRGLVDTIDAVAAPRRAGTAYAVLNAVAAALILLIAAPVRLAVAVKLDMGPSSSARPATAGTAARSR